MGDNAAFHSADGNVRYSDYIIYADESGNPNPASVDPNYPVFVLNFCVFRKDIYAASVLPTITEFKFAHFGHDAVVLHEQDIRRRNPPFAFLHIDRNRDAFMEGINEMITEMDFAIVVAIVDKGRLTDRSAAMHGLYETAFRQCMEQADAYLDSHGQSDLITHIILEQRGNRENRELERAFLSMQNGGDEVRSTNTRFKIVFADKRSNAAGLQIADLTARPIGLHFIRPEQTNRAWNLLAPKLYRGTDEGERRPP